MKSMLKVGYIFLLLAGFFPVIYVTKVDVPYESQLYLVLAWIQVISVLGVVIMSILNERLAFVSEWLSRVVLVVYGVLILFGIISAIVFRKLYG